MLSAIALCPPNLPLNDKDKLPRPPARPSCRAEPIWRSRSASSVGSALSRIAAELAKAQPVEAGCFDGCTEFLGHNVVAAFTTNRKEMASPRPVWQRRTCQRVLFYRHRIGQRSPSLTTPPLPMDEEGTTATASSSCPSPGLAKPRLCFRAILGWFQPLARLQQRGYSDGRSLLACVRARVEQSTDATWQRTCGWRKKRSRTPEKCPLQASASENFRGCRSRALTETTAEQLVAKAREP